MVGEKVPVRIRMPAGMVGSMDRLAQAHQRDRTGEILYACQLYIDQTSVPKGKSSRNWIVNCNEESGICLSMS